MTRTLALGALALTGLVTSNEALSGFSSPAVITVGAVLILSAGVGEGILVVESKPYHVFFQASRSEAEMLTPYEAHAGLTTTDLLTRK